MWKLNRGWWLTGVILLLPGVIALIVGIADPSARTSDDMPLRTFGIIWVLSQSLLQGAIFGWLGWQRRSAAYFREHGIRGVATILAAETTGVTVNDMPQIELTLEVAPLDRSPYVIRDKRCWNPLSLAGLQKGAKLAVLIDPRRPKKVMFVE